MWTVQDVVLSSVGSESETVSTAIESIQRCLGFWIPNAGASSGAVATVKERSLSLSLFIAASCFLRNGMGKGQGRGDHNTNPGMLDAIHAQTHNRGLDIVSYVDLRIFCRYVQFAAWFIIHFLYPGTKKEAQPLSMTWLI